MHLFRHSEQPQPQGCASTALDGDSPDRAAGRPALFANALVD